MDAYLLYSETPSLHSHTLKVAVIDAAGSRSIDGKFGFDDFRAHVRRRLHLLAPLQYRLVEIPWRLHHPMWLEGCDVDLDYHLRRVQVPAPGGRRELDDVISRVASTPLDRSRPLWEFHFAEGLMGEPVRDDRQGAPRLADGVASVNLLARVMDIQGADSDERDGRRRRAAPVRHAAAGRGRARPRSADRRVARSRQGRGDRFHPCPPAVPRTGGPPGPRRELQCACDVPQSQGVGGTLLRKCDAVAGRRQADRQAPRRQRQRHRARDARPGVCAELLLRYDGEADEPIIASVPTATGRSRSDHRQRDQRHLGVPARPRRGSVGARAPGRRWPPASPRRTTRSSAPNCTAG